jgi:signal transduction histidine kinase
MTRNNHLPVEVELTSSLFTYQGKSAIQFFLHDITTRKLVESQIRQRNIELSALNAVAATVSQSLDLENVLKDALGCVVQLQILGEGAQGIIFLHDKSSDTLSLAAHRGVPDDHPCLKRPPDLGECLCGHAVKTGAIVISDDCFEDHRHTRVWSTMPPHKDICLPLRVRGVILGAMDVRIPATKDINKGIVELLTSVSDQISVAIENAQLFDEIRFQRERLSQLGARLAEVEDAERKRIAMVLHDQVGESLTALGINLGILRKQLRSQDPERLLPFVNDSLNLVDKTAERVRDLTSELRPPLLDEYGLITTLQWYCEQFSERTGIAVSVSCEKDSPRLSGKMEIALYRIAIEALTNVAKHAKASHVNVIIRHDETTMRLEIIDDGIGFDTRRTPGDDVDRGWGLLSMAERAESLGGKLLVESDPSKGGTLVITEVPR